MAAVAVVVTCAAMLLGAMPAMAAEDGAGFSVSPLRVDLDTAPGTASVQTISVRNTSTQPATFTVTREDIEGSATDPEATPVLLGGEFESAISGYRWLGSYPERFTLGSGQQRSFTVRVSVPKNATGGHYVALVIAGPPRTSGDLTAQSRAAVLFLMNAGGAPPPEIKIDKVTRYEGGTRVTYRVSDDSTIGTQPEGRIQPDGGWGSVFGGDGDGGGGETLEADRCTLALPGGTGVCTFTDPEGSGGGSDGIGPSGGDVELVTEDGTRVRGQLPTRWNGGLSSLLLPLAGIAMFVTYFLFLRRRRQDREDLEDLEDEDDVRDVLAH